MSITLPNLGVPAIKPHLHLPVHERIARKQRRTTIPAPLHVEPPPSEAPATTPKPAQQR